MQMLFAYSNKVVLEPRVSPALVSPALVSHEFSNHESRLLSRAHTFAIIVNIRFENTLMYFQI